MERKLFGKKRVFKSHKTNFRTQILLQNPNRNQFEAILHRKLRIKRCHQILIHQSTYPTTRRITPHPNLRRHQLRPYQVNK